ncbi:MAG: alpha/beta hydrolase [Gammaproteobacteria bacterium]
MDSPEPSFDDFNLDPPVEVETGAATAAVIWLHGLGADGHDFEAVASALGGSSARAMRFVLPHAPVRAITINGGMRMRGWYDIADADLARAPDRAGLDQSAAIARALIAREARRGIASRDVFLAGFSQGGAVALHAALRFDAPLAGVIALSAYLPCADALAAERSAANRRTPILLAHGRHDPLIPIALARAGRDALTESGYAVEWREYPIEHGVCAEEIDAVAAFMARASRADDG